MRHVSPSLAILAWCLTAAVDLPPAAAQNASSAPGGAARVSGPSRRPGNPAQPAAPGLAGGRGVSQGQAPNVSAGLARGAASGSPPLRVAQANPPGVRSANPTAEPANSAAAAVSMPPLNGTPEQIFERSVAALESRRSIAARVRFRVDEFDETIVGSGLYLQQSLASGETNAAERALRFELKMPVDNASTSVIQVGDGARFWTREDLPGGVNLSVIDLERLRRGLQRQPNRVISPTTAWMALGGLPRMAQGIRQCFEFNAAQAGTLDKFPVVVLSGTWKKERLAEIAPDLRDALLAGQEVDLDKLPRHVPERVVLLLGRYDLFPYRVEYWRRMPAPRALKMLKLKPPVDKLLLAMELYEVQLDAPLDMRQFIYQPAPDVPVNDRTDAFLAGFGLKDEPQALRSPPATNRR